MKCPRERGNRRTEGSRVDESKREHGSRERTLDPRIRQVWKDGNAKIVEAEQENVFSTTWNKYEVESKD